MFSIMTVKIMETTDQYASNLVDKIVCCKHVKKLSFNVYFPAKL